MLIVLRTSSESTCWMESFILLFLLAWTTSWYHIRSTLISTWAFFRAAHAWNHLPFNKLFWCIWNLRLIINLDCHRKSQVFQLVHLFYQLLLFMLSSSFFKLLLVIFLSFKKWLSQSSKLKSSNCFSNYWMPTRAVTHLFAFFRSLFFLLYFSFRFAK